jgi:hypothetical protein
LVTTDLIDLVNVAFLTEEGLAGLIKGELKCLNALAMHVKGGQASIPSRTLPRIRIGFVEK